MSTRLTEVDEHMAEPESDAAVDTLFDDLDDVDDEDAIPVRLMLAELAAQS